MPQWQPHTHPPRSIEDDLADFLNATPMTAPLPPGQGQRQGRFVASQGDALLLNAMDQQRSSAERWMEILQRPAGAASFDGDVGEDGDGGGDGDAWLDDGISVGGMTGCYGVGDEEYWGTNDEGLDTDLEQFVNMRDGGVSQEFVLVRR